ncbi:uncharacterized protein N7459_008942 [Penicillium hispanicum]|uniref:uncharacterized protein n=1 Tax=Penicillium hispanicum TaxID=1080232 RepID=UPI00253FC5A1|nr:uncharacterized protein N7459_008942 [Penicillium hispanicum]KAJ5569512.1 hypothetical protein N7459_008942 [Penicillium hispanicum]
MDDVVSQRKRWPKQDPPILDMKDVPEGWNVDEPDLAESDIEAQIQRARDRMEEGILPDIFAGRLARYETAREKVSKEVTLSGHHVEAGALSFGVIHRLDTLKFMEKEMQQQTDKHSQEQLRNIASVIKAYESENLDWHPGKVTFWVHGIQVGEAQDFDWGDLRKKAEDESFRDAWVEGVSPLIDYVEDPYKVLTFGAKLNGPGPLLQALHFVPQPQPSSSWRYDLRSHKGHLYL